VPEAAIGVTAAEKVTDCPKTDGFNEDVTVTVEASMLMVSVNTAEVLPALLASPL